MWKLMKLMKSIDWDDKAKLHVGCGERVARTTRAVSESMLESHFGGHIMDELFRRFSQLVEDDLPKSKTKFINLVITLVKRRD